MVLFSLKSLNSLIDGFLGETVAVLQPHEIVGIFRVAGIRQQHLKELILVNEILAVSLTPIECFFYEIEKALADDIDVGAFEPPANYFTLLYHVDRRTRFVLAVVL